MITTTVDSHHTCFKRRRARPKVPPPWKRRRSKPTIIMRSKMMSVTAIEMREAVLLWVLTTIQVDSSDNHLERNYGQSKFSKDPKK